MGIGGWSEMGSGATHLGACLRRRRSRPHQSVSSRTISPYELPNSYENSEGSVAIPCVPIRNNSALLNPIHLFVESDA